MKKAFSFFTKIVLKCMPIKRGRIVFTSFGGHYSDSPKYIARKTKELKADADIIWLVDQKRRPEVEKEFRSARIDSFLGRYYASTAEIRIDNVYGDNGRSIISDSRLKIVKTRISRWLSVKRRQKLYTTWHGTPIKRMGRDQIGSSVTDFLCDNATMILDNQYTLDIMRHLTFDKMNMVLLGLPRNDVLFLDEARKEFIKRKLGLPSDRKIMLFAPSFRHDGSDMENKNVRRSGLDQLDQIDFEILFSALQKKFSGEWVFVCRFHYHVESMVNWEALTEKYSGRVINGNIHDDMAEYLACTDILLTDVSSCSFDFSITEKPCFLFFPDYVHYKEKERGFYCPVEGLPYPLSQNFEELISVINDFDSEQYRKHLHRMFREFGYTQEQHAAEKVAEYILRENNLL